MTEPQKPSRVKPLPKEEGLAKTRAWREKVSCEAVGMKMPDGTIFAGKLPGGKKVYAAPRNASIAMDFNAAADFVRWSNNRKMLGHADWRLPTHEELNLLYRNRGKGALKGSFDISIKLESQTGGDYWSSTIVTDGLAYMKGLNDGSDCQSSFKCVGVVRLVR